MKYEIKYKPAYAMLVVKLDKDEKLKSESGAMTYFDSHMAVETTKRDKGFLKTLGVLD